MKRRGVPRSVATKITGHRTESVYRRHAIMSDAEEPGPYKHRRFDGRIFHGTRRPWFSFSRRVAPERAPAL